MHSTIFNSPMFRAPLRWLSRKFLQHKGWRVDFSAIEGINKCVLIGAPHTSNWDLPYALMLGFSQQLPIYWMGKVQIFKFPFRHLMMWLGGIPINRSKSLNVVSQAATQLQQADQLYLVITPEGTRARVDEWKTGFYHIAHQANVPIMVTYIDWRTRQAGIYTAYYPSGDSEKDIAEIKALYGDLLLRHKGNQQRH
ncbi:1-acyl-sn-glycerol-3-phosphate acyltransferase [Amphritea sp. 1_MG-2023]|uniref:1-acyl-sn-glycerol-3-phosphate acyltransferase n=1 Tax=Amphritea sp. 1_MG-2023 TaxID=3062670 RepID=UPI0026E380A9|nr:1-acyl-sn-glycerol-3-phosphate acyltransferase [Amphritea sp. 1_MG-2023]MDO6564906.1 1-acyl-sn-glycerol-3-phosphate acyltransferase [Amphritea sp. 1_MG-2023]